MLGDHELALRDRERRLRHGDNVTGTRNAPDRLANQRAEIVVRPHEPRANRNGPQPFGHFGARHSQRRHREAHACSSSTISSSRYLREPFKRMTSSPFECSRSHAAACELFSTETILEAWRPARRAPRASAAAKSPLTSKTSTLPAAYSPTCSCRLCDSSPSSAMLASTAIRRDAVSPAKASSAAIMPLAFALYAS